MNEGKFFKLWQDAVTRCPELVDRFNEMGIPASIKNMSEPALRKFFEGTGLLAVAWRDNTVWIGVWCLDPKTKKWGFHC